MKLSHLSMKLAENDDQQFCLREKVLKQSDKDSNFSENLEYFCKKTKIFTAFC